ncbi:MAG: hypothetical protein AAF417_23345 [Pseudomonadota bacterium]
MAAHSSRLGELEIAWQRAEEIAALQAIPRLVVFELMRIRDLDAEPIKSNADVKGQVDKVKQSFFRARLSAGLSAEAAAVEFSELPDSLYAKAVYEWFLELSNVCPELVRIHDEGHANRPHARVSPISSDLHFDRVRHIARLTGQIVQGVDPSHSYVSEIEVQFLERL